MIAIKDNKDNLPVIQADNYGAFFQQEKMKFMSGVLWKKIVDSFWQEMRLHVSPNDVDELIRFLRNKRETILLSYQGGRYFQYWKDCFNGDNKQHDEAKFIKILDTVFDGQIDRADIDAFFSWHCLTESIDLLLGKVIEEQNSFAGATINFFYNDGGEIHFGKPSGKQHTEETSDEEPLKNIIFNERLFNSNAILAKLRDTIAAAIDMGDATIMFGRPQIIRINPNVQGEWYYLIKTIKESGIAKRTIGDTIFVDQMIEWFPMLFPDDTLEDFKDYKRRLLKSISAERRLWKQGKMKQEVELRDMWAKGMGKVLGNAKANRIYEIAYKGLCANITNLKHEIERGQE